MAWREGGLSSWSGYAETTSGVTTPPRAERPAMTPETDTAVMEPRAERSGSLKPVIDALPESVYDNPTWKGIAYFARDAVLYVGLLVALVFVSNIFAVAGLEIVMALVVSGLFIIGHDAAHGALFKTKRMNATIGRLAFLPSLHVW
jgi:omega-6 fatty acid desaturase (delta-12 desaturase)